MSKKSIRTAAVWLLLFVVMTALCACGGKTAAPEAAETLSDEQALAAIRNYCFTVNPDLESIADAGEYPVYWEIVSGDERETVVLYRSYTGAQLRYYIDRVSGEVRVTEFVPGITDEEQRTDESFNVREYIPEK